MESAMPLRFHKAPEEASLPRSPWSSAPPPVPTLLATVVIPAKNEVATIAVALQALAAQTDLQGCPLPAHSFEVLVLANNCTDETARVARVAAAQYPRLTVHVAEVQLAPAEAHIGKARRLLMDEACKRLEVSGLPHAFIASTDADTQVASTWLAAIAAELAAGTDAVGGRIFTLTTGPRDAIRRYRLQDAAYHLLCARLEEFIDPAPHDPWPRHHQHFGASLALTVTAYRQVGGLPIVPFLEDEALYQALLRHDLRLRHSPAVKVYTSDRQQGRVAVGLSWQLRQWADLQQVCQEPLVEDPARLVAEWTLRQQVRQLWQQPTHLPSAAVVTAVAAATGIAPAKLMREVTKAATFGQAWEKIRARFRRRAAAQWVAVPVPEALQVLRRQLATRPANAPVVAMPPFQTAA